MNIKRRVNNLIKKFDTNDPFKLAKALKINIIPTDLPTEIRGFLVTVLRRKIIIVNSNLDEFSTKVVVCHELGHARLHRKHTYLFNTNKACHIKSLYEKEANEFALYLLSSNFDFIHPDYFGELGWYWENDRDIVHERLSELAGCIE